MPELNAYEWLYNPMIKKLILQYYSTILYRFTPSFDKQLKIVINRRGDSFPYTLTTVLVFLSIEGIKMIIETILRKVKKKIALRVNKGLYFKPIFPI